MLCNPDTSQQAQEMVFSRNYSWNYFLQQLANSKGEYIKTPRSTSGYKIEFCDTFNEKIKKANKVISVIKKLSLSLPRSSLIIIYIYHLLGLI